MHTLLMTFVYYSNTATNYRTLWLIFVSFLVVFCLLGVLEGVLFICFLFAFFVCWVGFVFQRGGCLGGFCCGLGCLFCQNKVIKYKDEVMWW